MSTIKKRFDILCILTFVYDILSWMIEIWMQIHFISDSIYNTIMPKTILRGLTNNARLVLVTLHGQFTLRIEQQTIELVTLRQKGILV